MTANAERQRAITLIACDLIREWTVQGLPVVSWTIEPDGDDVHLEGHTLTAEDAHATVAAYAKVLCVDAELAAKPPEWQANATLMRGSVAIRVQVYGDRHDTGAWG